MIKKYSSLKFVVSSEEPAVFYRGGGQGSIPRNLTLLDILRYEKEELGNEDITVEPGINPKEITSNNLIWVCEDEESASQYGEPELIELYDYQIVAKDSEGGLLIEDLSNRKTGSKIEDMMNLNNEINYPPYGFNTLDRKSKRQVPFPEMTEKHLDDVKWLGTKVSVVKKCKPGDKQSGKPWCIYKHDVKKQPKGFPKHYPTKEEAEEGLRLMQIYKHKSSKDSFLYHVTPTKNVKSILRHGLLPHKPKDFVDEKAVYLFPSISFAEDAVMNWYGDRFEEDISLTLLKISKSQLDSLGIRYYPGDTPYEVISYQAIPPEAIQIEKNEI